MFILSIKIYQPFALKYIRFIRIPSTSWWALQEAYIILLIFQAILSLQLCFTQTKAYYVIKMQDDQILYFFLVQLYLNWIRFSKIDIVTNSWILQRLIQSILFPKSFYLSIFNGYELQNINKFFIQQFFAFRIKSLKQFNFIKFFTFFSNRWML